MEHSTILKKLKTRKRSFYLLLFIFAFFIGFLFTLIYPSENSNEIRRSIVESEPTQTPTPTLPPIPTTKTLDNDGYHIFQSYNNCGPAALSMALKFYGIDASQETLGQNLRPYQVPSGDNDDKSVTLQELAEKSKDFDLIPYHRPMGNSETVKKFIANDIPVITRTWTTPTEDIGHFRIIKGYDDSNQTFVQDDSLQDKNLTYSFDEFDKIWKKFNYEYLVLVPKEKIEIAEGILGESLDEQTAWQNAVYNSLQELERNPEDIYARFNLAVAYHNTGEHELAVEEFEKVEFQLPFRTLWYQIEPIQSYFELKDYDRVFEITDRILNNHNRAYSELYILRGKIYEEQGNQEAARQEYQNAVIYNQNNNEAINLLNSI